MKKKAFKITSFVLIFVMLFATASLNQIKAADSEYNANGRNNKNFVYDLNEAKTQGHNIIKISTDYAMTGNPVIGNEFKKMYGTASSYSKRTLGWMAQETITFAKDANIEVENLEFYAKRYNPGITVKIEEGATVKFVNCNFTNSVINNGTAIFENCKFDSGKIENNGTASYIGTTKEPTNIGTPKPSHIPLSMVLSSYSVNSVSGQDVNETIKYTLDGTNKAAASVTVSGLPEELGITSKVENGNIVLKGIPKKDGNYTLIVKASAQKTDGTTETSEKTVNVKINKKIIIELRGTLQSYITGVSSGSGGARGSDSISSATGSGGGIINPDGAQNKLSIWIKEGDGEFENIRDYQRRIENLGAKVELKVSPEGSGMHAMYLLDTVILEGTPAKAGTYRVTATLTNGGQTAISNSKEFRIYDPDVSLTERFNALPKDKEVWNMEPYVILKVGNSTVPKHLREIKGSDEHGLYGSIGNINKFDSEKLIIPAGADVKFTNMKINSNVRVIVEKGGKLTLDNSVIYGPLDVYGTLSTTSDNENHLHSTVNNKLTFYDGSTIENANLLSHARYLTDGNQSIPDVTEFVTIEGNVTALGNNVITGDKGAPNLHGQTAVVIKGTLNIPKGSTFTANGGGDEANFFMPNGGHGISLRDGKILGEGKLISNGGIGHAFRPSGVERTGGDAIDGKGFIDVETVILKGGNGYGTENIDVVGIGKGGNAADKEVVFKKRNITAVAGKGSPDGSAVLTYLSKENQNDKDNKKTVRPERENNKKSNNIIKNTKSKEKISKEKTPSTSDQSNIEYLIILLTVATICFFSLRKSK